MSQKEIIPAILTDSKKRAEELLATFREFADVVQIDVGDGSFSKTKTVQAKDFSRPILRGIKVEVHLMVYHPEQYVKEWLALGADRIILHAEANPKANTFHMIRDAGKEVLVGLTAKSDILIAKPYLHFVSGILFLSISPPGVQGQPFLPEVIKRINPFHKLYLEHIIEVDGGISEQTIDAVIEAGATRFVVGSALFTQNRKPKDQYKYLSNLLE